VSNDITVLHNEDYKIFDKLIAGVNNKPRSGPVGWVQVYMNDHNLARRTPDHEGSNLIVAKGREFVAQKIFETNIMGDGTTRTDFYNYKVSHFAVGAGGAVVSGQDVTLQGPAIADTALYQPISLGDEIYLEEPSHYSDTTESPVVHTYENAVKPIMTHGDIYLEPVSYEGAPDYYTKVKCTCVVPAGEPSMLAPGASTPINEASLYFVNAALADTDPAKLQMFSHICFPPKWKEKESNLTIFWYILC